ncbi:MAG TPA: carboxypeptidase regulatory-like domain-containing protein [Myxococcaceae bacterium]|nr:carboxypeptidase regulatory-like domain-containing protein [Myxococcaceae bacterium]
MSSPNSRSRTITLATLAAAALLIALAYSSCSKKEEEAPAPSAGSPPPAAQAQAPASPPAAGEASGGTATPAGAPTAGAPAPEGAGGEAPGTRVAMADKKEEKAKESAVQPPGTAVPVRGDATITGEVKLTGTPPEMQPLKRGVDPVCAKTQMNDEQVLSKDGKLENVVVWVSEGIPPQPAPAEQAKLQQTSCMYRPRVQAVQDGQTLSIHNGDTTLHNVRAVRGTKTLFNKAQPPGSADIAEAVAAGPALQFKCDVHPWMKAFAVVVPTPFHDVTGPDGKFTIKGLPPGQYTVSAWHELFGTKTTQITIMGGKATPVLFAYDAKDRG